MTLERQQELDRGNGPLTAEELAQGWHFCPDWDGLLVGPNMGELNFCACDGVPASLVRPPTKPVDYDIVF